MVFFMSDYIPISCSLHDELEAAATLRKLCDIVYRVDGEDRVVTGGIADLYARNQIEYLLLDSGVEIRLDCLIQFNGKDFGGNP
ncbi:MAG: Rho-binding antiterminator [Candidatus Latescibacterota bacterium]|jgi:Rho-binding antiterminator